MLFRIHRVTIAPGTRPEAIKLAPVIRAFQQSDDFRARVVITGQHYLMAPQQTITHITCSDLQGLKQEFTAYRPDLPLVQSDNTTAIASALTAFYEQIPVGHVEAGLRTDNLRDPFPEEANRRLISLLAHLHFAHFPLGGQLPSLGGGGHGAHHGQYGDRRPVIDDRAGASLRGAWPGFRAAAGNPGHRASPRELGRAATKHWSRHSRAARAVPRYCFAAATAPQSHRARAAAGPAGQPSPGVSGRAP